MVSTDQIVLTLKNRETLIIFEEDIETNVDRKAQKAYTILNHIRQEIVNTTSLYNWADVHFDSRYYRLITKFCNDLGYYIKYNPFDTYIKENNLSEYFDTLNFPFDSFGIYIKSNKKEELDKLFALFRLRGLDV